MAETSPQPAGYLTFTLHAHLPYVVNHGTWPHGMEWLHEAAAETYLPLLRVFRRLERDDVRFGCNLSLSPILLEQLVHPVFVAEFPRYLHRKILAAQEDEAFFNQTGEVHYAELARYWNRFFSEALEDFKALDGNIVRGFRHFHETGLISVLTSGATHGYLPLLGTDESIRAQVRVAVDTSTRHFGRPPRGIWIPECGYRPAGPWTYPVQNADGTPPAPGFDRIGVEQAISESGLEYFFVDTHLVEESHPANSPYSQFRGPASTPPQPAPPARSGDADLRLYHPHAVNGPYRNHSASAAQTTAAQMTATPARAVSVFPRDPRTAVQVWSGDTGYPGDGAYLDFHKKRWPGGHRYWRVTGSHIDMGAKEPYFPQAAADRVRIHAEHFVHLVTEALSPSFGADSPPILCAPFDAELFGHWWFEGPLWLEAVARLLHHPESPVKSTSCAEYLDLYPAGDLLSMHEGSWGAEGNNGVWLNPETSWTYTHIYPAEIYVREIATAGLWRDSEVGTRIVQQICRELLLLESSDWQFLITTGAARDYAEARFVTHNDQFNDLKAIWKGFEADRSISPERNARLEEIELRDGIFPGLDPALWSTGAHA